MSESRERNVVQSDRSKRPQLARALQEVCCLRTEDPDVCALEFIDSSGQRFAAVVNSSGISSVIGRLLDQACNPDFEAAALAGSAELPQCHIDASGLELNPGRSPGEIAVTLPIGCIELVVFLPLVEVLRSFADLAQQLGQGQPEQGQH